MKKTTIALTFLTHIISDIDGVMSSDAPVNPQASILMVTIEMMKKSDNQIIVLEKSMFS